MAKKKLIFKKDYSLTDKQKDLVRIILDPENKIIVIQGAPGTSKSWSACYAALKLYENNEVEKILLTKPIVPVGDDIGFLPGSKEDKTFPHMESFISNFEDILDSKSLVDIQNADHLEFKIVQFIRGSTIKNKVFIVDEIQNFSIKELMTIITRIGKGSKLILCGDTMQNDINRKLVCVNFLCEKVLKDVKGVAFFNFEKSDILRDQILIDICNNFEKYYDERPDSKNRA